MLVGRVTDSKRFFKSSDMKRLPEHFHFATVIDNGKGVGEKSPLFRNNKAKSLVWTFLKSIQKYPIYDY